MLGSSERYTFNPEDQQAYKKTSSAHEKRWPWPLEFGWGSFSATRISICNVGPFRCQRSVPLACSDTQTDWDVWSRPIEGWPIGSPPWDNFNGETFGEFLKHLFRHRPSNKKMIIILDNSRYHHARLLQPWFWGHRVKLRLDFLPPYSPQLKPIERVWKLTRKLCVHNRYFPTLEDLIYAAGNQFILWAKLNNAWRRLCIII